MQQVAYYFTTSGGEPGMRTPKNLIHSPVRDRLEFLMGYSGFPVDRADAMWYYFRRMVADTIRFRT